MRNITELSQREYKFIKYIQNLMIKKKRSCAFTNYYYLQNILGYKDKNGCRYLVKKLIDKKLIDVTVGTNYAKQQYIKVMFARPRVAKKLVEAYESSKATVARASRDQKDKTATCSNVSLLNNNNINKINQINHKGEKTPKSNTTVQEMMRTYNELLGSTVSLNKRIAQYMYAAFKQKFNSIGNWCNYIKFKLKARKKPILDKLSFLMILLNFSTINAALGDMRMSQTQVIEGYTAEAAQNHIATVNESDMCKYIRRCFVANDGIPEYFHWLAKVKLKERADGNVEIISHNARTFGNHTSDYVRDYIETQYGWHLEKYAQWWREGKYD